MLRPFDHAYMSNDDAYCSLGYLDPLSLEMLPMNYQPIQRRFLCHETMGYAALFSVLVMSLLL